jgi:hypothetical protein
MTPTLPDGELWGDQFTMQVALRCLQIIGDYTSGLPVAQVREVGNGLRLVPGNVTAQRLGRMLNTLMDTAITANLTASGQPLDWEKVKL